MAATASDFLRLSIIVAKRLNDDDIIAIWIVFNL